MLYELRKENFVAELTLILIFRKFCTMRQGRAYFHVAGPGRGEH